MGVNHPGDCRAFLTLPAGNHPDRGWTCSLRQGSPLGRADARADKGPVDVHKVITASARAIAVVSVVVEARVIRGKPWYRRSPTILWQDFHAAMMRPIRKWLRHHEIARQRAQDQEQPSRQATECFYFDDPQWRHRLAPEWRNRPALELLREYLDRLEEIVNAAEAKFAPPGDDEKGDSDE